MDRKSAILKMGIITMVCFLILIIILGIEAFYFNFCHGLYVLCGVLILKFAIARNAKQMLDKINRDYPKDENSN